MKPVFRFLIACLLLAVAGNSDILAQTGGGTKKNFGYSQNPKTKPTPAPVKPTDTEPASVARTETQPVAPEVRSEPQVARNETTIAEKTLNVAKTAARRSAPPTETYVVGPGDVLFIALQNNSKASSYFTVLNDGSIDYGLAGEMVQVAGLTTDEIEEVLTSKIKLYENPQVSVKVREFNSHRVKVLGLVENGGDRSIQREAVPLFVIRADAVVKSNADRVSVKRGSGSVEKFDLKDPQWENVLVYAGDIVEFTSSSGSADNSGLFVFVSGEVVTAGKFAFSNGLTLSQAIIVAGGLKRAGVKKATLKRRNAAGLLEASEYNLRSINDGKAPDPILLAGDIIEIGNQ